jgi:penicillin amidase
LPQSFNPAGGIIATANARVVPDNYPYFITSLWEAPYRTARIFERLRAGGNFSVDDMLSVQCDILALDDKWMAGQLLQAASSHPPRDAEAQYAINLLRNWDGRATMDSGATLVCEVTRRALLERIVKPKLGEDLSGYHWFRSTQFLANVLANNWVRWLPPGDASFSDTLMAALYEGIKQIPKRAGDGNPRQWQWGSFAPLLFEHPLGQFFPLDRLLNVGPFPQAGKGTTVKATGSAGGSSMRVVVDLADLDHSVQNLPLGQSGQVFSPYYKDQFEAWYHGRSFPMPFSDPAVEQSTVHKLLLRP